MCFTNRGHFVHYSYRRAFIEFWVCNQGLTIKHYETKKGKNCYPNHSEENMKHVKIKSTKLIKKLFQKISKPIKEQTQ